MGNKLLFLDILISNNENFQTSVFHKKLYTGLLMNYFSFVPNSYKYGSIKHQLIVLYPLSMIDNGIKKYLENAIINTVNTGNMPVEMPN